jgi:hypothetical protein
MTARQCGGCTLCCKLVPVRELGKPGGARCDHQRHRKGCAIYSGRPPSCRTWSCKWLIDGEALRDLRRPDRVGYVIDPMPDFVRLVDDATGKVTELPVIQIWLDRPDAHRDPALRAWLDAEAQRVGMGALARMPGNNDAIGLFAPSISADKQWHEVTTNFKPEAQHSSADIARVMAAAGLRTEIALEERTRE